MEKGGIVLLKSSISDLKSALTWFMEGTASHILISNAIDHLEIVIDYESKTENS